MGTLTVRTGMTSCNNHFIRYDFVVNFFAGYPEFAKNEFYLTAESYGGIYIPMYG